MKIESLKGIVDTNGKFQCLEEGMPFSRSAVWRHNVPAYDPQGCVPCTGKQKTFQRGLSKVTLQVWDSAYEVASTDLYLEYIFIRGTT